MFLKYRTAQNIVIGGLAGALPPVIAWISISNEMILYPIILCLIIFLWTPPHSWALAIYRNQDYSNADVPMYPVKHGIKNTLKMMNIYTFLKDLQGHEAALPPPRSRRSGIQEFVQLRRCLPMIRLTRF